MTDEEIRRLQTSLLAAETKIRELEDTIAKCVRRGASLRDALTYYEDIPGPASDTLRHDRQDQ